jgi:transposase
MKSIPLPGPLGWAMPVIVSEPARPVRVVNGERDRLAVGGGDCDHASLPASHVQTVNNAVLLDVERRVVEEPVMDGADGAGAKTWEVSDGLWERIEPLLPKKPRRSRYPRRKPFDDRLALQGILFVLHTWIGWGALAAGARLRLRDDGLAAVAHLAAGRRLGAAARTAAGRVARRRPARVGTSDRRRESPAGARGAQKWVPAPSIAAGGAASTTSSWTAAASRRPGRSPAATERAAWFKDSEGNLLAIGEPLPGDLGRIDDR